MAVDVETAPARSQCGVCAQLVEVMGRVERDRLVTDHTAAACDDRCICARGPICSCKCGGDHHGAGLMATIRYTVDRGAVPVVSPASASARAAALARFEAYAALRDELAAVARVEGFARQVTLRRVLQAAARARVHVQRMTRLRAALGRPVMAGLFD
jgi:hypothetical protein